MGFVKLDTGILNSTLWLDVLGRDVFITALLMAMPFDLTEPMPQIEVNDLSLTGWIVPPGTYGFVEAAGPGIVRQACVNPDGGMAALERLCAPDPESRSREFEGRRLARINGGYLVLNYARYRERDYKHAERQRRYRESHRDGEHQGSDAAPVTGDARDASRDGSVTQAEDRSKKSESEESKSKALGANAPARKRPRAAYEDAFEAWFKTYPKRTTKAQAYTFWRKMDPEDRDALPARTATWVAARKRVKERDPNAFLPEPPDAVRFIRHRRWEDVFGVPAAGAAGASRCIWCNKIVPAGNKSEFCGEDCAGSYFIGKYGKTDEARDKFAAWREGSGGPSHA